MGLFSEFASRGFIVFAPFHKDKSCKYTETQDGKPITCEPHKGTERWTEKVAIRENTLVELWKEINSFPDHLGHILPSRFDNTHWYMMGHSAGGNDAYLASKALGPDKIKACVLYDGAVMELTGENKVNSDVPLLSVTSTSFVPMMDEMFKCDIQDIRTKLHAGQKSPFNEWWSCPPMGHMDFCDMPFTDPYICKLFDGHMSMDPTDLYLLNADLFYSFCNKIDKDQDTKLHIPPKTFERYIDHWMNK